MTSVPRAEETTGPATQSRTAAISTAERIAERPRARILPVPSYASLFLFYLPLGFSGLLMLLDTPFVNGVLNRFPNPDNSVAALRVAFSLAMVYEASHVSMIDASTALSADKRTFLMLRRFYIVVAVVLLAIAAVVAFSPLYDLIVRGAMSQAPAVAEAAHPAIWVFLLWPIPIGWRRLYQGALIRHGHPKPVGAGGLVRMATLVAGLAFFSWFGTSVVKIEPAAIAVLAMLVSVTAEALAVNGWTLRVLRTMPEAAPGAQPPTYREIWRFVFPLSGTSIMNTLVQPTLTAGIAAAAVAWGSPNGSVVAVASYAIAWSMGFLLFGPTLSMTQASIAWHSSDNPHVRERGPRVLIGVGVALAFLVVIATFTPVAHWIFRTLLDAEPVTAATAVDVAHWLIPMPILSATSFMLRGKLIARRDPHAVRLAQAVDVAAIILIIWLVTGGPLVHLFSGAPAAPLAAVAYNSMLCIDIAVLLLALRLRRPRTPLG